MTSPTIPNDLNCVAANVFVVHHEDISFTLVATVLPNAYHVDFKIYEARAIDREGNPLYGENFDITDWKDAEVYASGSVKWDGCSNWQFDEQNKCMLHGCNRQHLINIGEVLARCWDMTKSILPTWSNL